MQPLETLRALVHLLGLGLVFNTIVDALAFMLPSFKGTNVDDAYFGAHPEPPWDLALKVTGLVKGSCILPFLTKPKVEY